MNLLLPGRFRFVMVALCLLGLGALSGCNSNGSGGDVAPGTVNPRFKKLQDDKAKADAAKK